MVDEQVSGWTVNLGKYLGERLAVKLAAGRVLDIPGSKESPSW